MKTLYTILFLFITAIANYAQVYVVDANELFPLESANIVCGNYGVNTDATGYADIKDFCKTDTVKISYVGYYTKTVSYRELINTDTLFMQPNPTELGEISVVDKRVFEKNVIEHIKITQEETERYTNVSKIIEHNSTLRFNDYGTVGALKSVSARGLSSENTLVLFNEAKVNDIRTGSFDFSSLSSSSLGKVEYHKSADNNGTAFMAGGVVKLYTQKEYNQDALLLSVKKGSAGAEGINLSKGFSFGNYTANVNLERTYARNDYDYNFEGESFNRNNAHYSKSFASVELVRSGRKVVTDLYMHYSAFAYGLPGFIVTNNHTASKSSNNNGSFLTTLNNNVTFGDLFVKSTVSYHNQQFTLKDPVGTFISDGGEYTTRLNDLGFKLDLSQKLSNNLSLTGWYNFQYSALNGIPDYIASNTTVSKFTRRAHEFRFGGLYTLKFTDSFIKEVYLTAGTSYQVYYEDIFSDNNTAVLGNVGTGAKINTEIPIWLKLSFSSTKRLPTFNERYFSAFYGIGELMPEEYNGVDFSVSAELNTLLIKDVNASVYLINGENKIIWVPYRSLLQVPRNVLKNENSGFELITNSSFWQERINLNMIYTYTKALNKSSQGVGDRSYNKQLINTPEHNFNVNLDFAYPVSNKVSLTTAINYQFTGKRYYASDNNPISMLKEYNLVDFHVGATVTIGGVKNRFNLSVYNLFDEEYMVMQSYPMPLRSFMFTYGVEI